MSFKLTPAQQRELQQRQRELSDLRDAIVSAFNQLMKDLAALPGPINILIRQYNDAQAKALKFTTGIAEDFRAEFDERSEGWQNGERGTAAGDLIGEWEAIDFVDVDPVELIAPDVPDLSELKAFTDLPTEPNV